MSFYLAYHGRPEEGQQPPAAPAAPRKEGFFSIGFYAEYARRSPWERVLQAWQRDDQSFLCITTGVGECDETPPGTFTMSVLEKWQVMEGAGVLAPLAERFENLYLVHFDPLVLKVSEHGLGMTKEEQAKSLEGLAECLERSKHNALFVQQKFTPELYALLRRGSGRRRHLIFDFAHVVEDTNGFDTTLYSDYFTQEVTPEQKEYVIRFGYMGDQSDDYVRALVEQEFLYRISVDKDQRLILSTLFHRLHAFYQTFYSQLQKKPLVSEPINLLAHSTIPTIHEFIHNHKDLNKVADRLNPSVLDIKTTDVWRKKVLLLLLENVWNDDPDKGYKFREELFHRRLVTFSNESCLIYCVS